MKKELAKLRLWAGLDGADYSDDMKWTEMKKNGEELPKMFTRTLTASIFDWNPPK